MKSAIQVITNSVDLRFKQRLIVGRESGRDCKPCKLVLKGLKGV